MIKNLEYNRFSRFILLNLLLYLILSVHAQPAGYYDEAEGLTGEDLKEALHQIIRNHNPRTYAQLWQDFYQTDRKENDKVWDMYSDHPGGVPAYEYSFFTDQCGNYSAEGHCYNREHTWPASWFNKQLPMYTDLYHITPVDGYVNNRRANYPYGEVAQPSWVSTNGSKLGPNTTEGYSGIVFEPIDEYKGDFARGMLYMNVRYLGQDANWKGSDMADGAELRPWAVQLMLKWHNQDPVSEKELERNEKIYALQNNRNPFIDVPEFAQFIWADPSNLDSRYADRMQLRLSPNPVTDGYVQLHCIDCKSVNYTLHIIDLSGKIVMHSTYEAGAASMPLSVESLAPGFYVLQLTTAGHQSVQAKLIKN